MSGSVRKKILGLEIEAHPVVFPAGALIIIVFVLLAALFPGRSLMAFNGLQSWIAGNFSWLYIFSMTFFLLLAVYLGFSRYGNIRLGSDDSRPEFSTPSWFAMLFSAGMGIGMLFYGVVEPMTHYMSPVVGEAQTLPAARQAMSTTLFHWCLHPWALYVLVGLSLAYFGFRRNLPLSFRSVFYPLIGERIHGRLGDIIDVMAVLATLFGLATSLGLGAKQVNAGLNFVFGWPEQNSNVQIVIIACITAMAVTSLVSGLNVGIKWLSNINMVIAAGLLLFLFAIGPTVYLLGAVVENTGTYLINLADRAFWTASYSGDDRAAWFSSWTVFYWGWWIAWSPFVGMFIARISRGRTIREFVIGVLLVPTTMAIIWMTGFGDSALYQEIYSRMDVNHPAKGSIYDYSPHPYKTQVLDHETGLPLSAEGGHPVIRLGPGETAVLLRGEVKNGRPGLFETIDGTVVIRKRGVLVDYTSGSPYRPTDDSLFTGRYLAREKALTLGGYLVQPVLNDTQTARADTTATAMFVMLRAYPFTFFTAILGTLSVILFFVTSSDSASMVADIIASGGSVNPTTGTRIFWGVLEGLLAAVLLIAGGLKALQTGAITLGLPFCFVVLLMCYSLLKGLAGDKRFTDPQKQDHSPARGSSRRIRS